MKELKAVIWDLGGVLIDWNPNYVYEHYFESPEKLKYFFDNVCTSDWNEEQDAGRLISVATEELIKKHPEWEKAIRDYYGRWTEMLRGPIEGTVEIFDELRKNHELKFYALTNWSAETFPYALEHYEFLHWFDGRVVSGEEKMRKPATEFYKLLLNRYNLHSSEVIFIDDNLRNVNAARELGIRSIHFHSPAQLRGELEKLNLVVPRS